MGTQLGLFIYNLSDNSLSTFSKIDGLSSLNISALKYDQNSNSLLIGYNNGNIDVLQNNTVINLPDIFFANIVGEKRVNNIFIHNNLAYISCSFGLVIYNLEKKERLKKHVTFITRPESLVMFIRHMCLMKMYMDLMMFFYPKNFCSNK